jgi:glutathione S-transferase
MDLYFGTLSGNSARAVFGLLEAGAVWTPHPLDPREGENRAPGYLTINPMGKVPALVDGPLRLWESNAITWYAAERNPTSGLLPGTAAARASLHKWLFFQAGHVSPACVKVFLFSNKRVQAYYKTPDDPKSVEAGAKELQRFLPVLEEGLAGRDWLEGEFGLAEIAYAPHLSLIAEAGFDLAPWPRVRAWLERTTARPAWRRAAELALQG